MAALVPEKVYVCDAASSVPNSSAVPARSYSPCHADQYIDKKNKKKNNVIKKKIESALKLGGGTYLHANRRPKRYLEAPFRSLAQTDLRGWRGGEFALHGGLREI